MKPRARLARRGFTLAEVAVTIALVGIVLACLLESLSASKLNAAHARDMRLARELGLLTLGQIESGLFEEDLDNERVEGNYAEEGHGDFTFEAVIGDENFKPDEGDRQAFDNWRHEQSVKERDLTNKQKDEEEEAEQPYEKVQIKVTFPKIQDLENEYVLEKWVPWVVIHPPDEDAKGAATDGQTGGANSGSNTGAGAKKK